MVVLSFFCLVAQGGIWEDTPVCSLFLKPICVHLRFGEMGLESLGGRQLSMYLYCPPCFFMLACFNLYSNKFLLFLNSQRSCVNLGFRHAVLRRGLRRSSSTACYSMVALTFKRSPFLL